jgi:hypothetical protein
MLESSNQALNMRPRPFPVTQLATSASLIQAFATLWREYLMEAAELALLMFFSCSLLGTFGAHRNG